MLILGMFPPTSQRGNDAVLKMAMAAMADPRSIAGDVAKKLGIATTTLYMYLDGAGILKEACSKIIEIPKK